MDFTWEDGDRVIRFGRGALKDVLELLGEGYTLLSTERAEPSAPEVVAAAAATHHVASGNVGDLAADLIPRLGGTEQLVALGGGRVIDTAKAIAGVTGARVAAIPTTLSAAEMTPIHQLAKGIEGARHSRPQMVLNDPALSASQPEPELAASAANSLGHAVEGPLTPRASPVPTLAAREAQRLIDSAYLVEDEPRGATARDQLALASLLSGYSIGAAGYGLHHVMSQTLRAIGGAGHGPANAAMLPHTIPALERRFPGRVDPDGSLTALAERLARLAHADGIRKIGVSEDRLQACAQAAARRVADLEGTPPPADADELLEIYRAAW